MTLERAFRDINATARGLFDDAFGNSAKQQDLGNLLQGNRLRGVGLALILFASTLIVIDALAR